MKDLVFQGKNNQVLTSSLLVAEKFGKRHVEVLDAVRELIAKAEKSTFVENQKLNKMFALIEQEIPMPVGGGVKKAPAYVMNRDGFTLLVMGFTGEKALQFKLDYIEAFNKMESAVKNGSFHIPGSFKEALLLAAHQQEQIESQQKQIEVEKRSRVEAEIKVKESAPAVAFTKAIQSANSSCLIGELAKLIAQNGYAIGEKRLFAYMRANGYLGKHGERYNIPNQQYIEQGLFELKKGVRSGNGGVLHTTVTPKVTGKGQVYFVNKFIGKEAPDADQL